MKKIELTQRKFALVDNEDFEWLNQWKWSIDDDGYAVRHERKAEYRSNPRRMRKMHREILLHHGINIEGKNIDHKNLKEYDNRKNNLRIADYSQNMANSRLKSRNGYRGVLKYNQNKPWAAAITFKGKRVFKGMFKTVEEAALVYNELAKRYFGEFSKLNKIERMVG